MTETHATVRAVFRMWTGAGFDAMAVLAGDSFNGLSFNGLSACALREALFSVIDWDVTDDGKLLSLPSCPVCGVLLTMAEENRRTE